MRGLEPNGIKPRLMKTRRLLKVYLGQAVVVGDRNEKDLVLLRFSPGTKYVSPAMRESCFSGLPTTLLDRVSKVDI